MLITGIKKMNSEIYRFMLFGIAAAPKGNSPFVYLDENCQYSEHGRIWFQDDIMFPKRQPPSFTFIKKEVEDELVKIWEENYKS